MGKVTVYFFSMYDIRSDENVRSKRPATLEAIKQIGGRALTETAIEISDSELDDDGFRRKVPPAL
jgi:hypothetical protein